LGSIKKKKKTFKGLRALIRTSDEDEEIDSPEEEQYRDIKKEYNSKKRALMDKRNLYYKLKQEIVLHQLQEDSDTEGEVADLQQLENDIQSMEGDLDNILLNMSKMERNLKTDDGQDLAIVRDAYLNRHDESAAEKKDTPSSEELEEAKEAIAKESTAQEDLTKDINDDKNLLLDILKESMVEDVGDVDEPVIDDTEIDQAYVKDDDMESVYSADVGPEEPDEVPDLGDKDEPKEEPDTDDGVEEKEPSDLGGDEQLPEEPEGSDVDDVDDDFEDEIPDVDISELEKFPIRDISSHVEEGEEQTEDDEPDPDNILFKKGDIADIELHDLKHFKGLTQAMGEEADEGEEEQVKETTPEVDATSSKGTDVVEEYDQDDIKAWKERETPKADETTQTYSYEPNDETQIYDGKVSHSKLYDDSKIKTKMTEIRGIEQGMAEVDTEITKLQDQLKDMDTEAEYWEILHEKGFALSRIGQYDEAIYYYDKALQLNADNEEILSNKGVALFNLDKREEAKACFAVALKIRPSYEKAWNNLGVVMRAEGKLPEALRCYNQAIKANPYYKNAWYNKGFILEDMGDLEEALKYYNQAIEISPNYAEAIYYRDECLAKLAANRLGKKEKLEKAYEEEIIELDRQLQEELDSTPTLDVDDLLKDEPEADEEPSKDSSQKASRGDIPVRRPKKTVKKVKKKKKKRAS